MTRDVIFDSHIHLALHRPVAIAPCPLATDPKPELAHRVRQTNAQPRGGTI